MNHKRQVLFFIVLTIFASSIIQAFSKPKIFKIRKEDTHVEFSVYKWAVIKEEGKFKEFDGTIMYDPENAATTIVDFTIYATSVDSRNEGRDQAIRSEAFFNVASYPTLTFKSLQVQSKGKDSLLVEGILTMKGVAKRITIPVKVTGTTVVPQIGTLVGFETTFIVNREDYGIAKNSDLIGKDVTIHLLIGASSKD